MVRYSITWSLILVFLLHLSHNGSCKQHCKQLRCRHRHGPIVRFPFRLRDAHPPDCGYPGFELSCSHHRLLLQLSSPSGPLDLFVKHIDYQSQTLQVYDPQSCLPSLFLKLHNSSISPFKLLTRSDPIFPSNFTFLNCSSTGNPNPNDLRSLGQGQNSQNDFTFLGPKQNMFSCPIYVGFSGNFFVDPNLLFCTKILEIPSNQLNILQDALVLSWSKPDCTECELKGKMCNLKNNGTVDIIECHDHDPNISRSTIILVAGTTSGSILLLLVFLVFFWHYRRLRLKREDHKRLEKFLADYQSRKPTRFSYAELNRITCGFKDKLGEGTHGAVFKGKLSNEIVVAVKMLNNSEEDGKEFLNEVGAIGKIHHVNVVRLLGFCADGFRHALVYDFFPNGSLQNFISTPNDPASFLGWEKLQQIAIGIAKGIEYLHQGCEQQILHFDINPHNVLLDDNFIPKISDFGLAKLCPKNQSTVLMTAVRGTMGYIAPEVFSRDFGNVSYKADIYSFGILLIEMVGGRKNTHTVQENVQVLYPEWIHNFVEGRDTHIQIQNEEDIRIAKKLAIVGLWCIQWHPINRPSIKIVVQMLGGDEDKLEVPPAPFDSSLVNATTIVPARHLNSELEVIEELE